MIIKTANSNKRKVSQFDLLGNKETALCKAFAYTISDNENIFQTILKELFNISYARQYYKISSINIEHFHENIGRTDLEILFENKDGHKTQIIFECKVNTNKISKKQNEQYIDCFIKDEKATKILCFVTQNVPSNRVLTHAFEKDIKVFYYSWSDIVSALEKCKENTIKKDFIQYYTRGYKMKNIKEILIQDLSNDVEMDRLFNYGIYKTRAVTGIPLYFAPHFSKNAINKNGITEDGVQELYDVLGVITGTPADVKANTDLLENFAKLKFDNNDDIDEYEKKANIQKLKECWKDGIYLENEINNNEYTYYFLGDALKLPKVLKKDTGIEKGRGKNWIAASISKNRCVSFKDLIARFSK